MGGPARRGEWSLASSGLINTVRWHQMCTAFRGEEEQLEQTRNSSYSCQDYSREHEGLLQTGFTLHEEWRGGWGRLFLLTLGEKQENVALLKGKTRQQGPLSEGHGPTAPRQGGQSRSDAQGQPEALHSLGKQGWGKKQGNQLRMGGCTVFNIARAWGLQQLPEKLGNLS